MDERMQQFPLAIENTLFVEKLGLDGFRFSGLVLFIDIVTSGKQGALQLDILS